jgi:hypothetical protein
MNPTDNNIVISGMAFIPGTHDTLITDDINDAFAARISSTGNVEWFVTIAHSANLNDQALSLCYLDDHVYVGVVSDGDSNP